MKKVIFYSLLLAAGLALPVSAQHMLTLEECKTTALTNNIKTRNSRLAAEAAAQTRSAAFTAYFPSLSAGALTFSAQKELMEIKTAGGNLPVYDGNPANLMSATQLAYMPASSMGMLKNGTIGFVNLTQPLFAGGRIINGNRLAAVGRDATALQEKLAIDGVNLKTEELYWQIISLQEKRKTVLQYEELLQALTVEVGDAYRSGLIPRNDLLKVSVKLSEVRLQKSKLENGLSLALMAFCQHMGTGYDSTIALAADSTAPVPPQAFQVDHQAALDRRMEYRLLQKSVEAEELKTSMQVGEYLPQAAVGLSGQYLKFDKAEGRTIGMAFGTVQIPISGWWEGSHKIRASQLNESIARNELNDKSQLLLLQMQKAWRDLTDAYRQISLAGETRAQAAENLKVHQDSRRNGMATTADLLEAQAQYQNAQDQYIEAVTAYRVKTAQYRNATATTGN